MRYSLLICALLYPGLCSAEWAGVAVILEDSDTDWQFVDGQREAQTGRVEFLIEEKTETGLAVGFSIGYLSLRVVADDAADTSKFDAQNIGIHLRQPIRLGDSVSLHGQFSYRYYNGSDNNETESAEIDWNETSVRIGASVRFSNFRITPFAAYYDIDGDISGAGGIEVFDLDDSVSEGIQFDYFVDKTAFVGLQIQSGDHAGGYLSFVRQY